MGSGFGRLSGVFVDNFRRSLIECHLNGFLFGAGRREKGEGEEVGVVVVAGDFGAGSAALECLSPEPGLWGVTPGTTQRGSLVTLRSDGYDWECIKVKLNTNTLDR
jgi:hypothetical protein